MEKILKGNKESYQLAAECIKKGGVIVAPSDTNLALTLDPWNEEAIKRTFCIKNRPATSPLTLFILDPLDWKKYGYAEDEERVDALVKEFWPGPLNIIVNKRESVPEKMLCGGKTVSISCLSNPVWRGLMEEMDRPVAMTSANLSGQAKGILVDMKLALGQIGNKVDYILEGEAQGTTRSSTIISLAGKPVITRIGDISAEDIEKVIDILPDIREQ